jgi:hypothetical protein
MDDTKSENDIKSEDIGKYARHPKRTAAGAMLIGSAIGAGMMMKKNSRAKTPMQKFMDRMYK